MAEEVFKPFQKLQDKNQALLSRIANYSTLPVFCHFISFSWTTGIQGEPRKYERQHHYPCVHSLSLCIRRLLSICNQFSSHPKNTIKTKIDGQGRRRICFKLSYIFLNSHQAYWALLSSFCSTAAQFYFAGKEYQKQKDSNSNFFSNLSLISHHQAKEKAYGRLSESVSIHYNPLKWQLTGSHYSRWSSGRNRGKRKGTQVNV